VTKDNCVVQVPQPLVHFPPFFPVQVPAKGFDLKKINDYGDIISVSAPETPRVRELLVFLAALTFVQADDVETDGTRVTLTIHGKEWRRRAGFGRTKQDRAAWERAIKILTGVQYDIEVDGARGDGRKYKQRRKPLPFRRVILTGIFNDVTFQKHEDTVTLSILADFVKGLDVTGLRISLTHLLSLRGNIARLLAYTLYGRQAWVGTWQQLGKLAEIDGWEASWKQKQALKKTLIELASGGFRVEVGEEQIKISRKKGSLGAIFEV